MAKYRFTRLPLIPPPARRARRPETASSDSATESAVTLGAPTTDAEAPAPAKPSARAIAMENAICRMPKVGGPAPSHTQPDTTATRHQLIGDLLRAGRRLSLARDALFSAHGLSGAKVRLLKTVRRLPAAFTVSELARVMDVTRQSVHPVISELAEEGLLHLVANTRHRKAPVVFLTDFGRARHDEVLRLEERWIADLLRGFDQRTLAQAAWVLRLLRQRLGD